MQRGKLVQWFSILVLELVFLKAEGSFVNVTYLDGAVAKGAVCLDGSPPAYHLDKGFGDGINSWLIQVDGGGWCDDVKSCLDRSKSNLGSSKLMLKSWFGGIMSNEQKDNPDFYNWNRVRIRYCDGSSFTSDIEAVDSATNLHFRGARVFVALVEGLLAKGLNNAENALLSGTSAGALTSILHCDNFRGFLPKSTKVKCLSDGGFFINVKDISGAPTIENFYKNVVNFHGSAKNLPTSCTSVLSPHLCFFPQNIVPQMQTPLFILNTAYDSWQIQNILVPGSADPDGLWHNCFNNFTTCSPSQLETLQDFRLQFINVLSNLGNSTSRGVFLNSCDTHCQSELQQTWFMPDSPKLNGITIAKAVGDWFYDRSPFQNIDCPYPCDKTCYHPSKELSYVYTH